MNTGLLRTLAPDPALPQRDALLDPTLVAAALSSRLSDAGPLCVIACERTRANYQPGKSLRVLHRLQTPAGAVTVAARAFRGGRSAEAYALAMATRVDAGGLRPIVHDAALDTVFWTFPNDRRIENLRAVVTPEADVATLLGSGWRASRLVAYAPEKSATLQCLDDAGRVIAYAKVCARGQAARDEATYRGLRTQLPPDDRALTIPAPLACSDRYRLLLLQPLAGRRLTDSEDGALARDLYRMGAALARLHELPPPAGAPRFTRFDAPALHEAVALVAAARPDVAAQAADLVSCLAVRRPADPAPPVGLHGDVHPKNVILTDETVGLIDFEDFAVGPAAADVASLLAALMYQQRTGQISESDCATLTASFSSGYASVRALPDRPVLMWHAAVSLLVERAARAVTRVRPDGLRRLDAVLRAAHDLADEVGA